MHNNRFIVIIAAVFSLLVNIPRIVFLFGRVDGNWDSLFNVSVGDTVFRFLSLFLFCAVILKLNIDWIKSVTSKYQFPTGVLISVLLLIVWMVVFRSVDRFMGSDVSTTLNPGFNFFIYFFILLMLLVISRTMTLMNQSKLDALERERLKRQSLLNELAALKNQVNPHFLFNSLNSLTLLVREDRKAAGKFINKLSFLYRYILQSKDRDLVTVKEELEFLESYIYLIKQRYRDNFKANIEINDHLLQKKVPTLALQLLMENAVKHNEISNGRPLHVDVYNEGDCLLVKNRLQKRSGHVESTHTGLSNLNTRFKLHLNKEIVISMDDTHFTVKLPLA